MSDSVKATVARLKERRQHMIDRLDDLHEMGQASANEKAELTTLRIDIEALSKTISELEDQLAQGT